MRFLRPDLLNWGLVVPLLAVCWGMRARLRAAFVRRMAIDRRFAPLSRRATWRSDVAVLAAGVTTASAIVFALMRPQLLLAARLPDYERQDLIVLLDRSVSMRARDVAPSRFARATGELRTLLLHKPEGIDRIGLVGFADSSVILSYLTDDVESLLFYLDWLDGDSVVLFGTNFGAALNSARDVARKDDRPTRKRFLLVSDGEDNGGELDAMVAAFQRDGYRIDTIGIGADQPVAIPLDSSASEDSFLRDDAGRRVTTTFSEATLARVALSTGGRYVRSSTGEELARAIPEVVRADRRILGWRTATEYRDLYPYALGAAALAAAVLCFLV